MQIILLKRSPSPNILFLRFFGFVFVFDVGHFLKFLLNLFQYCFCFALFFLAMRQVGFQLPNRGSNPCPRHWKVKSHLLDRQVSPSGILLGQSSTANPATGGLRSVSSCPSATLDGPLSPRSFLPVPKACCATSNHYYYCLAMPCSLRDLGP